MAYDNDNIFAKILRGEQAAFTVYENDDCLAFLDVMPQSNGHTLVLPKAPAKNLFDLAPEAAREWIIGVQHVARHQSNGFRRSVIFSCFGRGMSPDQEPRQDRNSSDHSSAGSRMTRRPSLRTRTSPWATNRHSFGSLTAWLPPF